MCNVRLIARLNDNDYYRGRGIFLYRNKFGKHEEYFSNEIIRRNEILAAHKLRFPRSFVSLK